MASEDATDVFQNNTLLGTLNTGESLVIELPATPGTEIIASRPVQVDVSLVMLVAHVLSLRLYHQETTQSTIILRGEYNVCSHQFVLVAVVLVEVE